MNGPMLDNNNIILIIIISLFVLFILFNYVSKKLYSYIIKFEKILNDVDKEIDELKTVQDCEVLKSKIEEHRRNCFIRGINVRLEDRYMIVMGIEIAMIKYNKKHGNNI